MTDYSNLRVSPETASLIKAYDAAQNANSILLGAIEEIHGDDYYKTYDQTIREKFEAYSEGILSLIQESIKVNRAMLDSDRI